MFRGPKFAGKWCAGIEMLQQILADSRSSRTSGMPRRTTTNSWPKATTGGRLARRYNRKLRACSHYGRIAWTHDRRRIGRFKPLICLHKFALVDRPEFLCCGSAAVACTATGKLNWMLRSA